MLGPKSGSTTNVDDLQPQAPKTCPKSSGFGAIDHQYAAGSHSPAIPTVVLIPKRAVSVPASRHFAWSRFATRLRGQIRLALKSRTRSRTKRGITKR